MLQILIADGHEIARGGVRGIIEPHPGWQVRREAAGGDEQPVSAIVAEV